MCFWRPVGVRAGEVGAPLEFTSGSSWAGKGRRGTAAGVQRDPMAGSHAHAAVHFFHGKWKFRYVIDCESPKSFHPWTMPGGMNTRSPALTIRSTPLRIELPC